MMITVTGHYDDHCYRTLMITVTGEGYTIMVTVTEHCHGHCYRGRYTIMITVTAEGTPS